MTNARQRHGCLTAWLILIMIVNSLSSLSYLFFGVFSNQMNDLLASQGISIAPGTYLVLVILGIFNVVCSLALWNWKKWGFYGFIASSVAAFIINVSSGQNIVSSLLGLIGIAILYGILNIGGEKQAWSRLE